MKKPSYDPMDSYSKADLIHGKEVFGGPYSGCRWCAGCQGFLGSLASCQHYDVETLAEISESLERWRKYGPARIVEDGVVVYINPDHPANKEQ